MRALIVVDFQNDFLPRGALEVPRAMDVLANVNYHLGRHGIYALRVLTQDWHTRAHHSFASTWGKPPFSKYELPYGEQTLWPDHCIAGTRGAELSPYLDAWRAHAVIRKGYDSKVDSYSGFKDAAGKRTGLDGLLSARGITDVDVVGLATDYCVAYTACDARFYGFQARVLKDACAAIDQDHSLAHAIARMHKAGVRIE